MKRKRKQHLLFSGLLFFSVLVILTALLSVGSRAEENLLINASFEESDEKGLPEGWKADAYVMDTGYTVFSVTEEDSVDGSKAACIRNIGDNDARFSQKVAVEPESLYRFSGYIRTENVSGGRGANLSVEGLYTFSSSIYDTSDGWQYVEWYGETGEDQSSVTLFVRLGGYSGESTGTAWFDDLKLIRVRETPGAVIAAKWYQERIISYYDENEEVSDSGAASAAWPRLIMLALLYSLFAILLTQWLRRTGAPLRTNEGKQRMLFFAGLAAALALRMILSYQITGYMVDVNCFNSWGATMAAHGPAGFYPETNFCDYPPAYTYILGLNSLIAQSFPEISEGMRRVIFRFFPAVCDIICCLILDRFLEKKEPTLNSRSRYVCLLLIAFHPVLILNCAAWGQMDSVLALLLLLVAVWAIDEKWELSLPCYMLAVLVKPQALMLGFLGLAAILMAWIRKPQTRKKLIKGALFAAALLLAVVIPFSLRQEPFWIVNQYGGTLASYPYATVNTANFYYLLDGNWKAISSTAPGWTAVFQAASWRELGHLGPACAAFLMTLLTALYGILFYKRAGKAWKYTWIECALSALFMIWYIICGISGSDWTMTGTAAMVFAFIIVLSLFIRKGDITFLPFAGGLLFYLLYVFGLKMHERYIFPAFLLTALAYGLKRDRRILYVFLAMTCTAFINEGIVLDNSIRLGSANGHLNPDTHALAMILSAVNCLAAAYSVHLGLSLALPEKETPGFRFVIRDLPSDNRLHWKKADTGVLCAILAAYSLISFTTLGSTKAPQTAWTSTEYTDSVELDLGKAYDNFSMLYFARVSRYDFSVATSQDGISWADETWAQMDQGQCWKWKYVTDSTQNEDGTRSFNSSRHWFDGRYVRITAHQINLALCEVIFRDPEGNILPVASVRHVNGDPESPLYSDPNYLIDEQDTLEPLPFYLASAQGGETGETDPRTAQPSWWNSTYFDEIYHARTAWEFLQHAAPYETSHPPLGKVLMSWGVAIFGMTPFGWRFAGALAGTAMLVFVYLITKQLTKKTAMAAFACGLMAMDCMHLTQTQIATIDSFPVLFILMSFFFILRFIQTDWYHEKYSRILTDLALSGFSMGLAVASKWIGLYAGAGLAVLYFWHGYRVLRLQGATLSPKHSASAGNQNASADSLKKFLILCLWSVLFFVILPIAVYLLSYVPYLAYRHFTSFSDYLEAVISSQQGMFNYHSTPGLGMDHPFYSPWYEWPIMQKPMFYATKQYVFTEDYSYSIFCFGNPAVWWTGIPAMLFSVWCWIRNREEKLRITEPRRTSYADLDTALVFILIGFLAEYLPWILVPRGTYIYHYFASVPFLIFAISLLAEQISQHSKKAGFAFMIALSLLAAGLFALLFPYASGVLAPVSWLDVGRNLLKIWY